MAGKMLKIKFALTSLPLLEMELKKHFKDSKKEEACHLDDFCNNTTLKSYISSLVTNTIFKRSFLFH